MVFYGFKLETDTKVGQIICRVGGGAMAERTLVPSRRRLL